VENRPYASNLITAISALKLFLTLENMLTTITPVILTYNEAPNIQRTLQQLTWAVRIVVIDSGSTDSTLSILQTYPQVETFQRSFDTHTNQWNYGLEQVETEWVLSLDADYYLSDALIAELKCLALTPEIAAYSANFKYCVYGHPLKNAMLPPRTLLFRKSQAHYIDDGHTQLLQVQGNVGKLVNPIFHDDHKSFDRWLWAQTRYARLEVKKLQDCQTAELGFSDRIRQYKLLAPFAVLIYYLIFRGGIFEGRVGWYYAFQRMIAETILSIYLLEIEQDAHCAEFITPSSTSK